MIDHGVITTKLWFEALALVHHVPDHPCTDEFIRGVKKFKETKKISFGLIFAAQVNVDIHQVVGSYAGLGIHTLLARTLEDEEYAESIWMDMTQLFRMFGEEQFFVGARPDKVSGYAKRFMLQVGVSAATFAKKRRRVAKMIVEDFSRAGTRFLTTRASIHEVSKTGITETPTA
ncbi:unnamed protein product [Fusarium equiseti]|uniref:Uncharacterized protein n=1 Tax=Fusarium equiseti TaxID=61235 RepID=A0A8J2JA41_FUSEQ|nr:unnamed protein product [Fusarium equiseti]